MKIFNKILCLVLLLCCCCCASAQNKERKRTKRKAAATESVMPIPGSQISVMLSLGNPPVVGGENHKFRSAQGRYGKQWLIAEIEFSFNSVISLGKGAMYENVKVELYLHLPKSTSDKAWFYGVQKIHSLLVDPAQRDRHFFVSLFMVPNDVYRFVTRIRGEKNSLLGTEGVVLIYDKNDRLLGYKAFLHGKEKLNSKRETAMLKQVNALHKVNSRLKMYLWPREKTPWQWVNADNYELPPMQSESNVQPAAPAAPAPKTESKPADEDEE